MFPYMDILYPAMELYFKKYKEDKYEYRRKNII